jgi:hypothetical protein
MPSLASGRSNILRKLPIFGFVLVAVALSTSNAVAGGIHDYFASFYGVDYYDGQRTGLRAHRGIETQYHGGFYGPAMMYDRQYGDQNGYRVDPGYSPVRNKVGTGYGGNYFPNWFSH